IDNHHECDKQSLSSKTNKIVYFPQYKSDQERLDTIVQTFKNQQKTVQFSSLCEQIFSKKLNSNKFNIHSKCTIIGTDRTTYATVCYLAIQNFVSQVIIYDPTTICSTYLNDLLCAFNICKQTRNIHISISSDIQKTSDSNIIIISHTKEYENDKTKFSFKDGSTEIFERFKQSIIIDSIVKMSPNAVFLISAYPTDYNCLLIKSLGNLKSWRVCGTGTSLHCQRLKYILSQLLDINSKNLTGFCLGNDLEQWNPYWPSITLNGLSISQEMRTVENNKTIEQNINMNQSSNDTTQRRQKKISTKENVSSLSNKKLQLQTRKTPTHTYLDKKTSLRIQEWLRLSSSKTTIKYMKESKSKNENSFYSIKKFVKTSRKKQLHSKSNDLIINTLFLVDKNDNKTIFQNDNMKMQQKEKHQLIMFDHETSFYPTIKNLICDHLQKWHCLLNVCKSQCSYLRAITLSNILHSVASNSDTIHILSTNVEKYIQHKDNGKINLINLETNDLFVSIPSIIRRYGIYTLLNFKSQMIMKEQVNKFIERNAHYCSIMNYPQQKIQLIYDLVPCFDSTAIKKPVELINSHRSLQLEQDEEQYYEN
ncbi:unnamed protein product, partial [Didymodactylos carnosus]